MLFARKLMELGIILREINQTHKCDIYITCFLSYAVSRYFKKKRYESRKGIIWEEEEDQ
jgi:hypothetical protein